MITLFDLELNRLLDDDVPCGDLLVTSSPYTAPPRDVGVAFATC
ncbi:MAG: hypothetical protein Q8M11_12040 [Sulfuritalea sp.]|jgi:hypothetical protein|nr:hypothetical protein [Sulfuritalea sp.]MDP1981064.1 hypothetical protein [Sulfuritalea sp.]